MSQTVTAAATDRALSIRQDAVLALSALFAAVGAFPYHLLFVFALLASITLVNAHQRLRLAVGGISVGLLLLGVGQAFGIG